MNRILVHIGLFIVYLLLQVVVFNHFTLANVATPHIFLLFLLMLPITLRYEWIVLIAFFGGLMIDLFSFNFAKGLHAFSCVLMVTVRVPWINVITNRVAFRGNEDALLLVQPTTWYVNYLLPLIFIHHLAYYFLEAFSFDFVGLTLAKVFFSTLFTFLLCMAGTLLLYKSSRR